MNCTIRRFAAALLVGAVLLQSYFIREIVVLGILFSLLLLMALVGWRNGLPVWLRGVVMARTTAAKSRQASHCLETEEHRTMTATLSVQAR